MRSTSFLFALASGLLAVPSFAEVDLFGLGNGHDGPLTLATDAGATVVSSCAPVTAVDGGSQLIFASGSVQPGQFAFGSGSLVLISRSTGLTGADAGVSGDQNAVDLSGSPVGLYELARVASVSGDSMTFTAPLLNAAAFATNAQVIAVPELTSVTLGDNSALTAPLWNGQCGGIVAFLATGTITLDGNGSISASASGFRGGTFINHPTGSNGCTALDGAASGAEAEDAQKGEGLVPARYGALQIGRGNVTNGAGGGNCHNAGGAGGAHGGKGGAGGTSYDGARVVGGLGGAALTYSMLQSLVFGGGGGASSGNNNVGTSGGRGGGIVLVRANALQGTGFIRSNAAPGPNTTANDAAGGGGAGGAISLRIVGNAACGGVEARGGNGGNVNAAAHGPGGGGGGGRILFQAGSTSGCALSVASGVGGTDSGGSNFGSGPSSSNDAETLGNIVTVPGPLTPPVVAFTAPSNGAFSTSNPPVFSGTATAGAAVSVRIGGSVVCTGVATSGTWSCTPSVSLPEGSTTATATSSFQGLTSTVASVTFVIDSLAPAVALTTPIDSAVLTTTTPTFSGTAEANSAVRVLVDGLEVCTATATGGTWSCVASALAQGAHNVSVVATDAATNSAQTALRPFRIDSIAPAIALTVPSANALVTTTTPTFSGTAEAGSSIRVLVDGLQVCTATATGGGSWSCVASTLSQGGHNASAVATDAAGNSAQTTPLRPFVIDSLAPSAPQIDSPTQNQTVTTTTPTFSGTAEANSAISVSVGLNVVCTTTANGSGAWSCAAGTALSQGAHDATATATDAATNVSGASTARHFFVDTLAPMAPLISQPTENQTIASNTPTLSGTAENGSTVRVSVDGTLVCTAVTNSSGAWSCASTVTLAQGAHVAVATATDAVGNASGNSVTRHFSVDTVAPTTPIITSPTAGLVTFDATPTFAGTAGANATVTVSVDSVVVCTATSNGAGAFSCAPSAPLAEGAHSVNATATDSVGNASAPSAAVSFTVDSVAPGAPVLATPANGSVSSTPLPTFTGTAETASTVTVRVDGQVACTSVAAAGAFTCTATTTLGEGEHLAQATATDAASNVSAGSNVNAFRIDVTAPFTPSILVPSSNATTGARPVLSGLSEAGSTVTARIDGNDVCTGVANAQGGWACSPATTLSLGAHSATAIAVDAAGNASSVSPAVNFTVAAAQPPAAPVFTSPVAGAVTGDTTPTFSGVAEPNGAVDVKVDGVTVCVAASDSQGHFSCDPTTPLAEGNHTVIGKLTVGISTSPSSSPVSFTIDLTAPNPPTIIVPIANAMTGPMPTFQGEAEANSTVTVRVDSTVVCTATADAQGTYACVSTAALTVGAHVATATAADASSNVSLSSGARDFSVATAGPPGTPVVTSPTQGASTRDNTPPVTGTAAPGSTVQVNVDGAPTCTAVTNSLGQWACTPATALGEGDHAVTATATTTNGTSPASSEIDFVIDSVAPNAPAITTPAQGATTSPSPFLSGTTDEPSAMITVRVDGAVVCLVRADSTGAWSCVVGTALADGPHDASASATDAAGNESADSPGRQFIVSHSGAPSAPTLTAPSNGATTRDATPTFSGMAEPASTVTIRVDGSVVCTTVASAQGSYSCDPASALTEGSHSATATASNSNGTSSPSPTTAFAVDTTAPVTPVITSPAAGGTSSTATPTFGGTAEPGSTVVVRVDGAIVCTATASSQGAWSCTPMTPLAGGSHDVKATATDGVGNVSPESATRTFTVMTSLAAPLISAPAAGASVPGPQVAISGTAPAGSAVTVKDRGGLTVCHATTNDAGLWSCEASLVAGDYSIAATAALRGLESSASATVPFSVTNTRATQTVAGGGCSCDSSGHVPLALIGAAMLVLASRRRRW